MTELKYWLWLTLALRQKSRKITALLEHFENPVKIYQAKKKAFRGIEGLSQNDIVALCDKSLYAAESVMAECMEKGIRIMTPDSPYYPRALANIFDPPYVLYVKSKERRDFNQELMIAMVGTRKMTTYGRAVAMKIGYDLASAGVTVVSGMARGIDGASLAGALNAGGKTIAVLGCGVDVVYPPEHKDMMNQIAQSGMVISEYPPGSKPLGSHFPVRNRIISGLCAGTVVVESPESGGSLITANLALEQNRDVFAVPGNINHPLSDGTNELIRQGAHLVTSALDIISEYREEYVSIFERAIQIKQEITEKAEDYQDMPNEAEKEQMPLPSVNSESYKDLSENERRITDCLSLSPSHVDTITEKTGLSIQEVNAALTLLEMKGIISQLAGRHYILNQ